MVKRLELSTWGYNAQYSDDLSSRTGLGYPLDPTGMKTSNVALVLEVVASELEERVGK